MRSVELRPRSLALLLEQKYSIWNEANMEEFFLKNAWVRGILPIVFMSIAGVTASSLVVEIASGNQIEWSAMFKKISFYLLLLTTIASALYQIKIQKYDRQVSSGLTAIQYEAAIRTRVAEGVAERSMKLIQDGKIEQLEQETEAFKRLYGVQNK
ncbi:hypothetical protein D3C77_497860 [compost metagenome]